MQQQQPSKADQLIALLQVAAQNKDAPWTVCLGAADWMRTVASMPELFNDVKHAEQWRKDADEFNALRAKWADVGAEE